MIRVVFDTSTVVAAIFWPRSTTRRAWTLVARRQVRPCLTSGIEVEYRDTCLEFQKTRFPDRSPLPFLGWIQHKALHCVPAPLGKPRSRDATDDPFLACALAAEARFIVASDRDLLALGKPFGISIVTPAELIRRASGS
ncbi:MAG: putative toxin-antitoxin system toxin component, PIN family [Verrucomicrobiia bacterium]